jgi:type II secretory pathway component GspD/PulD (secretin)
MHSKQPAFRTIISSIFLGGALLGIPLSNVAYAQKAPTAESDSTQVKTFYLNSGGSVQQANELLNALLRVLNPATRVNLMPSEYAISVRGTPEQIDMAAKLIADLNHPQRDYRLTYTMSEMDGSKRVGVQHYTLVMFGGARARLKQGSRVPVATGTTSSSGSQTNTTLTFIDVGMNVDATLAVAADGILLQSKIEDSGLLEDRSIAGVQEPMIRQTTLEGSTLLQPGKPVALGSLDIPGSTRHLDVEVLLEPMR